MGHELRIGDVHTAEGVVHFYAAMRVVGPLGQPPEVQLLRDRAKLSPHD